MEAAAARTAPAAPAAAVKAKASAADARAAKKELQRIERQLDRIGEKESALHTKIADNPTDFGAVAKLDAELRALGDERDELEMRWLELADEV